MNTMHNSLLAILLLTGGVRAQVLGDDGLPRDGRLDVTVTMSGVKRSEDKTYVGHYGLVFKYSPALVAEPMMKGDLEVVNIHHVLDEKYDPVQLNASDWRPENFSRLRLVQILIMPNAASSYATLAELIEDKKAAMDREGLKYQVSVQTDELVGRALAPIGAYTVATEEPYCLYQHYYRSKDLSYIVTAGCGELDVIARIQRAITKKIDAENPRPRFHPTMLHALWRDPEKTLALLLQPGSLILFSPLLISAFLLPFYFLGSFGRRLFSAGAHGLSVGLAAMLAGWIIGFFGTLVSLRGWDAAGIATLVLLASTFLMARHARRRHGAGLREVAWRVLLPAAPVAVMLVGVIGGGRRLSPEEAVVAAPLIAAGMSGIVCSAAGLLWGLLSKAPGLPWRRIAMLIALIVSSPSASAQFVFVDGYLLSQQEIDSAAPVAREILAAKGTVKTLTDAALADAKARGEAYDLQRVEVTGMWSADDTDESRSGLFNLQIKPSFLNEESLFGAFKPMWKRLDDKAYARLADLTLGGIETLGKLTERAQDVVKALEGQSVNELVAHSWGSQIVYNAILEGKISPPKRLIVVGPPENNTLKWELLAKHTGTEVIVVRHLEDPVNSKVGFFEPLFVSDRKTLKRWDTAVKDRSIGPKLNKYGRAPKPARFITHPTTLRGMPAHDRIKYYEDLDRHNLLVQNAREMELAQDQDLARRIDDDLTAKFEEMKRIVAVERRRQMEIQVVAERPPALTPSTPSQANPGTAVVRALRPIDTLLSDISRLACANPPAITDKLAAQARYGEDVLEPEGLRRSVSGCELAVMDVLIDVVQGRYGAISASKSWIERIVRDYRAANSPRTVLPSDDAPPPRSGGDCHRGDDPFGCQPRHP